MRENDGLASDAFSTGSSVGIGSNSGFCRCDTPENVVMSPGGAVLLAFIIGFLMWRGRRKDRRELDALALEAAEMYEALGPGGATAALPTTPDVDLTAADRPVSAISGDPVERRRDERRQVVSELIDNQPDEVAELLRGWLGDRRSVRR